MTKLQKLKHLFRTRIRVQKRANLYYVDIRPALFPFWNQSHFYVYEADAIQAADRLANPPKKIKETVWEN